jgi:cell division septation protein DedD
MARHRLNLIARIPIVDVQAKDRLTGAVILVVLLVLVVPELLSGPGRKVAAVALHPSDEPPLRSYTVELGDEAHAHHAASPAPVAVTPPPAATLAPAPATTPAAVTPPAVTMAPPVATAPAALTPPQREPARAPAAASRVPPEAPAQPSGVGWTIQLGSFASRANAERLVRELKARGFTAFWSESAGGGRKLYRVRVGPAADHASAEALRAKLHAAGHSGSLTQHP